MFETSILDYFLNSSIKNFWIIASIFSPPIDVSPFVAITWNTPCIKHIIEISNVPPPKSYTAIVLLSSPVFDKPYAKAAAVG